MSYIFIDNLQISHENIKSGEWPELSDYFHQSLIFCQEWLNGKQSFHLQTSGSTGKPKQITVTRHQMEISAKATGDFFKMKEGQLLLCCLNTAMIAGKMMLVRAMEWNCKLRLIEPSGNPLKDLEHQEKFDFVAMVPAQVENSLSLPKTCRALQNIQYLIIGGAPLSAELKDKISLLNIHAYQTYGMTETVSHIALAPVQSNETLLYHTLPGVIIKQDKEGKLIIQAPMATQELKTNDLVKIINEHQFIWKGRADFTINSGGIKIQPEEIEKKISLAINELLPGTRYFIIGEAHSKWGQQAVLVIESNFPKANLTEELGEKIKSLVGKYENPKKIYFIDNFTETASGKINRIKTLDEILKNQ